MRQRKVGLIPYRLNAYTQGVNPLKTFEYLAAGLSVVSTRIPAVEEIEGHVFVPSAPAAFVARVTSELNSKSQSTSAKSERIALAKQRSWTRRGDEARSLLSSLEQGVLGTGDAR